MITKSLLLTLALAASARADTYTWSGTDGNFSDPAAWSGPAPTIGGSPTDNLVFVNVPDATTTYTATIDSSGPWTLNSLEVIDQNFTFQSQPSITINAAPGASLLFTGPNPTIESFPFGSVIIDASIATTATLTLQGPFPEFPTAGLYINGTNNNYSAGTIISNFGSVYVGPNSSLGTGLVDIQYGTLHLSSPINIAPNQKILVEQYSTLAIAFDQDPTSMIDPASQGNLFLDTNFSTPLNLAAIGNGLMSLSSSNNSTYSAQTLAPDIDHIYRFGVDTGQGNITLLHSVLADYGNIPSQVQLSNVTLDASNSYSGGTQVLLNAYANTPGALGTGNVSIGEPFYFQPWIGQLFLSAPNGYAPSAQIDVYGTLAAVGPNGSIPRTTTAPILHPGSALILGDNLSYNPDRYPDSLPIHLNSSSLVLEGFGPTTTETVGPLSFTGVSDIILLNPLTSPNSTILHAPSLTPASPHSVLFIIPFDYTTPLKYDAPPISSFDPASASNATITLDTPPSVTNTIVPPYIQFRSQWYNLGNYNNVAPASFLTYTSSGFALAGYTPMPTTGSTGTEVVDLTASIALPADTSIYALRIAGDLDNPAAGPVTLHILSGGLITTTSLTIQPNIDFASAEAYINTDALASVGEANPISAEITGQVTTNNGLTKFGFGTLTLSNLNNQITGPLTILEGNLQLSSLPQPSSTDPIKLSSQATLTFLNSTILSRPVLIFQTSEDYLNNPGISAAPGQSLTIAAPITGSSYLNLSAGNVLTIQSPLNYAGTLAFQAPELRITANVSAGAFAFYPLTRAARLTGSAVISTPTNTILFQIATISPGTNPGDLATLTFDTPEFGIMDGAAFEFDLAPNGLSDHVLFTGEFDIAPFDPNNNPNIQPTNLLLNFLSPPTNQIYTLITASSITGTFDTVTGLPPNYTLDYTPTALLLIPTPEPTSLALLTFPLFPLLLRKNPQKSVKTPLFITPTIKSR